MPLDEIEIRTNEAIAINAIMCRLEQIGRKRFGLIEVDAKHVMELALERIVNDKVSPAYAEVATSDPVKQEVDANLIEAAAVFNREKSAA